MQRDRSEAEPVGDEGFTLIEMIAAIMVISVGLLGLMFVQVGSIKTLSESGQRQASTALANRAMEQMRALPYSTLTGGLVCANLAGDPNVTYTVTGSSCTAQFRPTYDSSINERVVVYAPPAGGAAQVKPLNPHVQPADETKVGKIQYTIRVYVTRVDPNPDVDAGYWLTAISNWTKPGTSQVLTTAARSRVYAPSGCLSANSAPFSGPCQSFFYTQAGVSGGGIRVETNRPGQAIVNGITATEGFLDLAGLSTRIQSEQVVSSQSTASTAASKIVTGTGESLGGGVVASSSADLDPSSGAVSEPSAASTASQTAANLVNSAGTTSFALTADPTSSVSAYSTSVSKASPPCADDTGSSTPNSQACTTASASTGGASSATLTLNGRVAPLATFAASSTPARAWGGRYLSGTATRCTGTSGVGCVSTAVRRSLGAITAGGLPGLTGSELIRTATGTNVTSSFTASPASASAPRSLVTLTGYSDAAAVEAGVNAGAGSSNRSGSLAYWNGTSFSPAVGLDATTSGTFTLGTVEGVYGTTLIRISGDIVVTAAQHTPQGASPCRPTACGRTRSGGDVVANLNYTIISSGVVIGDFDVTVDLGQSLAQSTFRAAPDA